jgi:hypothetical protein
MHTLDMLHDLHTSELAQAALNVVVACDAARPAVCYVLLVGIGDAGVTRLVGDDA